MSCDAVGRKATIRTSVGNASGVENRFALDKKQTSEGSKMRAAWMLAGLFVLLGSAEAAAPDASKLGDACFTRAYGHEQLIEHPGQRVSAISVHFHEFSGSLLAGISYRLVYG